MECTKPGSIRIALLAAFLTSAGAATPDSHEQLLEKEAKDAVVDPAGAATGHQQFEMQIKSTQPVKADMEKPAFEMELKKMYPATYAVYSSLSETEQRRVFKFWQGKKNFGLAKDFIISIATK